MTDSWQAIAARKLQEQKDRIPQQWRLPAAVVDDQTARNVLDIPRQCGLLSSAELHLTEDFDATSLLEELATGRIRSEDLTRAFCKRAAIATQLTACLTEIFFDDGIARAKELDAYLAKHGKPIGPLHGLPISLKDSFKVKGYDASIGIAAFCFRPAPVNSALVDLLLSLGAVLYCKTNVPQTLGALDSHNNIFGRTLNPANRALTAGGSSGGEGALLALRGSPLGVGTDVGGSIRVPAMCNGIYGVKPSHGRVPYARQQYLGPDGPAKLVIEPTAGPLAHTLRDCITFLRVIADAQPQHFDPNVFAQPWSGQVSVSSSQKPLRIGVVRWDGHIRPLPCISQFLDETAQRLRSVKSGAVEVIDVDASQILVHCAKVFNDFITADGGNQWLDVLGKHNEPLSPWLQPRFHRRPAKEIRDYVKLHIARHAIQEAMLQLWPRSGGYWRDSGAGDPADRLDVIICAPAPHPVPPVDGYGSVNYTAAWNLLDHPAGILPVRNITAADLKAEIGSEKQLDSWGERNDLLWTKVDREVYLDSPLSLQVVAPRLEERKLVESMAIIADALDCNKDRPASRSKL